MFFFSIALICSRSKLSLKPIASFRVSYLGIWKWSKPVIVLLASRVEQAESVGFASDHNCHGVIVEHLEGRVSINNNNMTMKHYQEVLTCSGWNVFLGPDVHSFGTWQVSFPVSKSIASRVNWAADIQGAPKHHFEHHWPFPPTNCSGHHIYVLWYSRSIILDARLP